MKNGKECHSWKLQLIWAVKIFWFKDKIAKLKWYNFLLFIYSCLSLGQEADYLISRKKAHVAVMQVSYSFLWHIYRVFENLYRNLGSNYLCFSRKGLDGNSSAQCWLYVIGAMANKIQTMRQQKHRPVIQTAEELVLNSRFSPPTCPIGLL